MAVQAVVAIIAVVAVVGFSTSATPDRALLLLVVQLLQLHEIGLVSTDGCIIYFAYYVGHLLQLTLMRCPILWFYVSSDWIWQ